MSENGREPGLLAQYESQVAELQARLAEAERRLGQAGEARKLRQQALRNLRAQRDDLHRVLAAERLAHGRVRDVAMDAYSHIYELESGCPDVRPAIDLLDSVLPNKTENEGAAQLRTQDLVRIEDLEATLRWLRAFAAAHGQEKRRYELLAGMVSIVERIDEALGVRDDA